MSAFTNRALAFVLLLAVAGCGLFETKKPEEKPPPPKQRPAEGSVWDQRIGDSSQGGHSDRIGAASIDTLAMGGPATSPKVADHLLDPSAKVRDKAVGVLAKWGKESEPAVPKILEYLRNVDANVRASSAKALAFIGSKAAEDGLERACKDTDARVRIWAHAGLARIAGDCDEHMEDIADLLKRGAAPAEATEAMGAMKCANREVIETLIEALKKGDEDTRSSAARALGAIGPKAAAAVPTLMGALDEKSWRIRQSALLALAAMGPEAAPAVPLLTGILKDRAPKFRELAAHALGSVGPAARSAVDELQKLSLDPEGTVQAAAKRALRSILGADPAKAPGP